MEIKKYIILGQGIEPKQLSIVDVLDLFRRTSRKTIKNRTFRNPINGNIHKEPISHETLPQFCERLNIIKNPAYEPGINQTR
jgi:hypothetical protein